MTKHRYAMIVEPARDKKGREYFCAWFPDLPGCATMGNSWEHLHEMAQEAIALHLWALDEFNQPIPEPSNRVSTVSIDVEKAIASQRLAPARKSTSQKSTRRPAVAKAGRTKHRAAKYAAAKNGAGRQLTVRQAGRGTKGKTASAS
jgi:predicted RNase H-like HicB family nuclease